MQLPTIAALLLLPLLAIAQDSSSTTTLTSTATLTKTITVSQVVASVTSTYGAYNSTSAYPTAVGTGSQTYAPSVISTSAPASTSPANFMGAASSLNSMYAGSAGVLVMIAAALL